MSLADTLRRWEIFSHFDDQQLEQLAQCASLNRFPKSSTVFNEGEDTRDSYLIQAGRLRIQRTTSYGAYVLATLEEGDLFGETSFIDHQPRSGEAFTDTDCELITFNPVALSALFDQDLRFTLALYWTFWKSLSKKLRYTNERLTRFFAETGKPPSTKTPPRKERTGEFRIDLASKRQLFEEQKLSAMEINFLASLSREKRYRPKEIIFREGEPGDRMFVVLEGRVMISKYIPGAGEEALAFLERGDYFGEMSLIDNQPRSADAKADEGGAVILAIPREVVRGILDIGKISSLRLLKILCSLTAKRVRELDEKLVGWYILAGGSLQSDQNQAKK